MNTLEYIVEKRGTGKFYRFTDKEDWESADTRSLFEMIRQWTSLELEEGNSVTFRHETEGGDVKEVFIEYKKDLENPELLMTRASTHDGTFLFIENLVKNVFRNLIYGETYNSSRHPVGYPEKTFFDYDIKYTISDLLWCSAYVDHVDEENGKMFPGQRDAMAMALEIEYIKK